MFMNSRIPCIFISPYDEMTIGRRAAAVKPQPFKNGGRRRFACRLMFFHHRDAPADSRPGAGISLWGVHPIARRRNQSNNFWSPKRGLQNQFHRGNSA
jgi:hypothetical protein